MTDNASSGYLTFYADYRSYLIGSTSFASTTTMTLTNNENQLANGNGSLCADTGVQWDIYTPAGLNSSDNTTNYFPMVPYPTKQFAGFCFDVGMINLIPIDGRDAPNEHFLAIIVFGQDQTNNNNQKNKPNKNQYV